MSNKPPPHPPLNIVNIKTKPQKTHCDAFDFFTFESGFWSFKQKLHTPISFVIIVFIHMSVHTIILYQINSKHFSMRTKRKTKISFVLQCQHLVIINHFKRICTVLSYTATLYALKLWYIFHKVILIRDYLPHAGFRIVLTIG